MADTEQNKQADFVIEKIKDRPVNKKKLLRRTMITASMAVIFGLIACLTFLILEPVFNNWLYPEEKPQPVVFPEESDEMSPEDMLVEEDDTSEIQDVVETVILEDEEIQKILEGMTLNKTHYTQLYKAVDEYRKDLQTSMATVTAVSSKTDWLNETYENKGQTYGVLLADNGKEYLLLTDNATVKEAEDILVTFCDNTRAQASIKQTNEQIGLAIISVPKESVAEETKKKITLATMGSSNFKNPVGIPVVAMGAPLGTVGSVGYGMIASDAVVLGKTDANYRLFATDIYGSPHGVGVLFNMQGQIIGIITPDRLDTDMGNLITAVGISDLRKLIENMSNGKETAYLGISGIDVSPEANAEMGLPFGAYIKEVAMNSPAMLAGIQPGDVIVEIEGDSIDSFSHYTSTLQRMKAGQNMKLIVQRFVQSGYIKIMMEITLGTAE